MSQVNTKTKGTMEKVELSQELREVFEKLIPIYEKAIEELPKKFKERDNYLWEQNLAFGLCNASKVFLSIDIVEEAESINTRKLSMYWCGRPILKSYEKSKQCLQWRVDAMKSLLEKGVLHE